MGLSFFHFRLNLYLYTILSAELRVYKNGPGETHVVLFPSVQWPVSLKIWKDDVGRR